MKALRRPLAPAIYLIRNGGKTVPLVGVIVLAVLLITGIVSLLNSIPLSIRTIYSYSRQSLGITPRGDPSQTPQIVKHVRAKSPVPIERVMICRVSGAVVRSIVGKWPFVVLGLDQGDMSYYLKRQGSRGLIGRLPANGSPEALISKPVAQNLHLSIGSTMLGPNTTDNYSPKEVKVVGIADTNQWIMIDPIEYQQANHFPPIDVAMFFAKNLNDQRVLDKWADKEFLGQRAQVFAYHILERDTDQNFATLYKILDVVIGTLVLVITLMMGLLINIYQSQRLVEFGLLQAIGHTKRQLIHRVLAESVIVIFFGWSLGILSAYLLLLIVKAKFMDPNAWALDPLDMTSFLYTLPAPFSILSVAALTVILRFRKFDPVGIVERRLV